MTFQLFVVPEVTMQHIVLFPEVALPVKFVPCQITTFIPFILGEAFGFEVAHRITACRPDPGIWALTAKKSKEKQGETPSSLSGFAPQAASGKRRTPFAPKTDVIRKVLNERNFLRGEASKQYARTFCRLGPPDADVSAL